MKIPQKFFSALDATRLMENPVLISVAGFGFKVVDQSEIPKGSDFTPYPNLKKEMTEWDTAHPGEFAAYRAQWAAASAPKVRDPSLREYDHFLKFQLLGDQGVGKSCLLLRYGDDVYTDSYLPTMGIDFKIRTIELAKKIVQLQIWNFLKQKNFVISEYGQRGTQGLLLVFDTTNLESFTNIEKKWLRFKELHFSENANMILVGTKSDLYRSRQVDYNQAAEFAERLGIPYIEVSSKTGSNVDEAFSKLTSAVMKRITPASASVGALAKSGGVVVTKQAAAPTAADDNPSKVNECVYL